MMEAELDRLDEKIEFALRQFDVGTLDPREPEVPLSMSNSINIGTMAGGTVQQGSLYATQIAAIELDID